MLPLSAFFTGGALRVTLSGETVSVSGPTPQTAAIRFDSSDGFVYTIDGVTPTQVDTAADYVRPESLANLLQIRFTALLGTITSSTVAEDVWHPFTSGNFEVSKTINSGDDTATFTIEIRIGTGGVIASGFYGLSLTTI